MGRKLIQILNMIILQQNRKRRVIHYTINNCEIIDAEFVASWYLFYKWVLTANRLQSEVSGRWNNMIILRENNSISVLSSCRRLLKSILMNGHDRISPGLLPIKQYYNKFLYWWN
jgi:hypothetical protein